MSERVWKKVTVTLPAGAGEGAVEGVGDYLAGLTGRGILREGGEATGRPNPVRLTGWLPPGEEGDAGAALARFGRELEAMGLLSAPLAVDVTPAEEEDWMEVFRSQHAPVRVSSRLMVRPSWWPPQGGAEREIVIDPGLAFGVGNHATTRLTLFFLDSAMGAPPQAPPARVLDLGTGTGILAIAAALLGAGEVTAVDNDPTAVEVARENAAQNGVEGRIRFVTGTLAQAGGPFEVIAANLSTPVLESIAGALGRSLAPGGRLLVSGIAAPEEGRALAAFAAAGLAPREVLRDEGWVAMELEDVGGRVLH